jgi:hypothetical protein
MDYYSVISRFDPQRHEFYRYEFRWPATLRQTVRVLIVADGSNDLSRLVDAVTTDVPYHVAIDITMAHHASGGRTGADLDGFRFTHGLEAYDQVWIIGSDPAWTSELGPGELAAIWSFMQGGGGVYVTGSGPGPLIPRVRGMRRWHPDRREAAAADDAERIVRPVMYPVDWQSIGYRRSAPHPVMCGRDGPITVLPEHAGTVEDPARIALDTRVTVDGEGVEEFPRCGATRVPPQVIATGTDPAGGTEFGIVSAYDGHLVTEAAGGIGRVVVDAIWHQRLTVTLDRFAAQHDAVRAVISRGATPAAEQIALAEHWRQVKDYFQNIAIWLARTGTQRRIRQFGLLLAANHVDALMTWRPHEVQEAAKRLPYLRELGIRALDAFHRMAPQYQCAAVVADLMRRLPVYEYLRPSPLREPNAAPLWRLRLFDSALVEQVALGGAVDALHRSVAEREYADLPGGRLDGIARSGAESAIDLLVAELRAGVETLAALFRPAEETSSAAFDGDQVYCP